jgi:hypothetical protein
MRPLFLVDLTDVLIKLEKRVLCGGHADNLSAIGPCLRSELEDLACVAAVDEFRIQHEHSVFICGHKLGDCVKPFASKMFTFCGTDGEKSAEEEMATDGCILPHVSGCIIG